jgi:predicted transcriptional regulator
MVERGDSDYTIKKMTAVTTALVEARRRAGLSQRELARRTGVAQPTIARIERGQVDARISTIERLLAECQTSIKVEPELGIGVDVTQIDELLELTPAERFDQAVAASNNLRRLVESVER